MSLSQGQEVESFYAQEYLAACLNCSDVIYNCVVYYDFCIISLERKRNSDLFPSVSSHLILLVLETSWLFTFFKYQLSKDYLSCSVVGF